LRHPGDFLNELNAQTGKKINSAQAASLNSQAQTSKPRSTAKQNRSGQQQHYREARHSWPLD